MLYHHHYLLPGDSNLGNTVLDNGKNSKEDSAAHRGKKKISVLNQSIPFTDKKTDLTTVFMTISTWIPSCWSIKELQNHDKSNISGK